MTEFNTGDKVRTRNGTEEWTVTAPPAPAVLLTNPSGGYKVAFTERLTMVPPADPRREAVRMALAQYHGVTKADVTAHDWEGALEEADAVLAALDALAVEYRDNDGDIWRENSDGTLSMVRSVDGVLDLRNYQGFEAASVHELHGPLTKV
ncbi:hypothetical protein LHJ74_30820 [Streptomyces sp. N2-109]|uniref:Uncharacterized protein n=1 Tax=Streptomyces gossypii TaxID=2883101 RepID=A0ABT2K406_9ACTN|nr:hypothetical protein [Streptomyces gossypii]MCT2594250.1 hypothetical protein [Streptomyces gossypii]